MPIRRPMIESTMLQLEILRRIPRSPQKITIQEIHQQLSELGYVTTERSMQRHIKALTAHFEDLECDDRTTQYAYCWKPLSKGLDIPSLSESQSLLLTLAEQQLKHLLPANIMSAMKPFFEQASRNIRGSKSKQWLNKVGISPAAQPLIPAKIHEKVFHEVSLALFHDKWLHIEYQNAAGKKHKANVMPLAIVQQGATIYLICRFEDFEDERLLALHRIRQAEMSNFGFDRPKSFSLQAFQEAGRLGFGDGNQIRLTFYISHSEGFHLTETPLSKDQKILEENEHHYRFQATVADTPMLDWWLRKFGEEIWDIIKEPV